jgi:dTDP-4-dehydrorhamnose reductase
MRNLRKVLLLGGSGFVGRAIAARIGVDQVAITYHRRPCPGGVRFDAAADDLKDVVTDHALFSHAVVLLGDTKLNSCFADQVRSHALNVVGICRVLDRLSEWNIVPVFTSTEAVFDGRRGDYDESDSPNPLVVYGKQKVEVEQYLTRKFSRFLLLRLANVYGEVSGDGTLLTDWADKIRRGETLTCAHDNRAAPIHVDDCAAMIVELMRRDCNGIYHVAGPRSVSRCDLVDLLAAEAIQCGSIPPSIKRCSIDDFQLPEPRPHDVSLNSAKCVAATGVQPRDVAEACRTIIHRTFGVSAG